MGLVNRTGLIVLFLICITGTFACFDLYTQLNIKNAVYGYFYSEPDSYTISDFEYSFTSLLFTNTGVENQYMATATLKAVDDFKSNKKYTVTINGNMCSAETETNYINVCFTNKFNSISDETLLIDDLSIKINFYTDGTKIVFITNNGENAVKLWSSYIAKHGFVLKIVETDYSKGNVDVDTLVCIKYSVKVETERQSKTITYYDYCKTGEDYIVKQIDEITEVPENCEFLGFLKNEHDILRFYDVPGITVVYGVQEDFELVGFILDEVGSEEIQTRGTIKFNFEFSESLSGGSVGTYTLKNSDGETIDIGSIVPGSIVFEDLPIEAIVDGQSVTYSYTISFEFYELSNIKAVAPITTVFYHGGVSYYEYLVPINSRLDKPVISI